jgi:hypothetical protein
MYEKIFVSKKMLTLSLGLLFINCHSSEKSKLLEVSNNKEANSSISRIGKGKGKSESIMRRKISRADFRRKNQGERIKVYNETPAPQHLINRLENNLKILYEQNKSFVNYLLTENAHYLRDLQQEEDNDILIRQYKEMFENTALAINFLSNVQADTFLNINSIDANFKPSVKAIKIAYDLASRCVDIMGQKQEKTESSSEGLKKIDLFKLVHRYENARRSTNNNAENYYQSIGHQDPIPEHMKSFYFDRANRRNLELRDIFEEDDPFLVYLQAENLNKPANLIERSLRNRRV